MSKFPFIVVAMIAFFSSSLALAEPPERVEYRIGAILPLSGPMAFAGAEVRNSINLALSDLGPTRRKYTVTFEDNGAGATATAGAAQKLLNQDRVNAVITLWPEAANVAAPITERKGVLHYTIAWDPQIACSNKLTLSHQAMLTDYARKTLELLKSHGVTSVAFFHDTVFQQGADTLAALAPGYGISFSKVFTFDRGKTDFRTELAAVRTAGGLLIWSIMPETEVFLRQVRELKLNARVTGFFDVLQDVSVIEGLEFPSEVYSTPEFQNNFEKRYGHKATMKGPNAYDIIHLLANAVESLPGEPRAQDVKQALLKVSSYRGAVGMVSIDSCGNSSYPIVIKSVRNGKLLVNADR